MFTEAMRVETDWETWALFERMGLELCLWGRREEEVRTRGREGMGSTTSERIDASGRFARTFTHTKN